MKKVVIVTWMGEGNYGTCLQSYALCKKIEFLGYKTTILTVFPHYYNIISYIKYIFSFLGIIKLIRAYKSLHLSQQERKRKEFQKANYHQCEAYINHQLQGLEKETDCFVSGSDQIWNTYYQFDPFFFLSFVKQKKRIAYASSIGTDNIKEEYRDAVRQLLLRFQHIGVREFHAVEVLQKLTGRTDIRQVLDPTLLLKPEEWRALASQAYYEISIPDKYIFCYFIGNNPWYHEQLKEVQRRTGIKDIIILPSTENPTFAFESAITYKDAGPVEFVDLLQKACYVCTDSFHATALSISNSKPFVEFMRFANTNIASQNSRIYDLLGHFGLLSRIYDIGSPAWSSPIDYIGVQSILRKDQDASLSYLVDAIEN